MTGFDLAACFLTLIGLAGWLNARLFRLPSAAIMLLTGLAGAGLLLGLEAAGATAASQMIATIRHLDFTQTVLGYLLAFLLFAGATQVDLGELRHRFLAVFSLATFGVGASIVIVSLGLLTGAHWLGLPLTLPWAIAFGALISPTDPIAVLAAVRQGSLPKSLETVLQGEALFNDGVGIVAFTAALTFVQSARVPSPLLVLGDVALSAAGGLALGTAAAFLVIRAIRAIDDYTVEVGITLALAAGSYALAQALHVSGPIAVVAAGLLFGDRGVRTAMSETTQRYVRGFWTLVDEILNALLFLLLGLEVLVVPINFRLAGLWGLAIVLVIAARVLVVLPWGLHFNAAASRRGAGLILSWGGLHGALSLALALSLPAGGPKGLILSTTFAVVVFSVLVQGLSFAPLARRLAPRAGGG
jgi:CPA1 family monovalent cation:H+ antiporter